ncbi:BMP family ABC transporter substrate-binding protein [Lapillicoccus sp.]|uniref:BMP family lipoprotein n=1 Tax=Lapillicoccus sp. TaxID=1909287 RepID=UPI0025F275F2|nr:BMP family ABC transporter substrate-binding protein [Lapillicoccus sp.]
MRSSLKIVAGVAVAGLALAGCGSKPTDTAGSGASATAAGAKVKACIVLDTGGVDDKSFNQSAWQGMQDAAKKDPALEVSYIQSQGNSDYEPNLTNSVKNGCKAIVSVGFNLADATKKVAMANPTVPFAIVDSGSNAPNVYGMKFETAQSGFQAGYLAAGLTKTGKVGTFGGTLLPQAVTDYMDGYLDGVNYYNQQKGKTVQVLGWNGKTGTAVSPDPSKGFNDKGTGRSITQQMFRAGADVIFPVAGASGEGALTEAEAQGGKLTIFWVDFPGCTFYPQDCPNIATSVLKGIPDRIGAFLEGVKSGKPLTGTFDGTLANGGTGIDGFNQFDAKIPADLKSEIATIKTKIISGEIKPATPGRG